jgi:hypothetical protein
LHVGYRKIIINGFYFHFLKRRCHMTYFLTYKCPLYIAMPFPRTWFVVSKEISSKTQRRLVHASLFVMTSRNFRQFLIQPHPFVTLFSKALVQLSQNHWPLLPKTVTSLSVNTSFTSIFTFIVHWKAFLICYERKREKLNKYWFQMKFDKHF